MSPLPFIRIAAAGLLATTLVGGAITPALSATLPVSSLEQVAGPTSTQQVRWWGGWGWRGYGWGWRRPNYGGAIAAGAIAGGILGLAASAPYYGYGYPAYYGYYPAYPRVYYRPAYYAPPYYRYRPVYYRRAYWRPLYYRRAYRPVYYHRAYWRPVHYRRAYYRPYFYRRVRW